MREIRRVEERGLIILSRVVYLLFEFERHARRTI